MIMKKNEKYKENLENNPKKEPPRGRAPGY
jgi:hypothetical protein